MNGVGGFISLPMSNTAGDTFAAGIPTDLSSRVEYYVNATESGGTDKSFPEGGESHPHLPGRGHHTHHRDRVRGGADGFIGGAPGDTATTGQWTLGNPIGTAAQTDDDHTAVGVNCWFTGQGSPGGSVGENDVDGGITTLLSPVFDASGLNSVEVSYWRWYSNTAGASPNADIFEVEVSADGGATWVDVETVGPTGAGTDGGWIQASFELASIVTPTSSMQLRFIASDLGNGSIVEAAIDDIEIVGLGSSIPDPVRYCTANPNPRGSPHGSTSTGACGFRRRLPDGVEHAGQLLDSSSSVISRPRRRSPVARASSASVAPSSAAADSGRCPARDRLLPGRLHQPVHQRAADPRRQYLELPDVAPGCLRGPGDVQHLGRAPDLLR